MSKYPHPIFRHYLEGEDDKPYYTMNSLAFYYEDMERKQKLIESLAKSIAGYDIRLTENLESIEQEVDKRLAEWDKQLETFPASVEDLLTKWTTDGTIDQVIQTALIDEKIQPLTAQLAETEEKLEINYPYLTNFFKALAKGNARVVFLGDSTTHANDSNNNYPHPKYLQDWFNAKYGSEKVTVINSGVSGNDLSLMSDRVARDVINQNPDVVVICSGWNDSNLGTFDIFEYRYNTIIELIKAGSLKPVDIVLRTPNYSSNADYVKPLVEKIQPLTEKIAKRNNVGLVDYFFYSRKKYEDGTLVLNPTAPNTTMTDFVHPNQKGQEWIGDFLKPMFDSEGNIGKMLNGVGTKYNGVYIEATNSALVVNNGYAASSADTGHIRSKRLSTTTAFPNKVATLNFYGTSMKIVVKTGRNMGMINVAIDGGTPVKHDLYELQRNTVGVENFKVIEVTGLNDSAHIVTVTSLSEKNVAVTGDGAIYLEGFIVEESAFYAYKFKQEGSGPRFEALQFYSAGDAASKTVNVTSGTSVIVPFNFTLLNDSQYIPTADNACVVTAAGLYSIDASIGTTIGNNRGNVAILKNGGILAIASFHFDNLGVRDRIIRIAGTFKLAPNDKISLQINADTASDNITLKSFQATTTSGMRVNLVKQS